MTKEIICTICSKDKRTDPSPLPAYNRYLSPRINQVKELADEDKLPFFILSVEYGLIPAEKEIKCYDHLLLEEEVTNLTNQVKKQLQKEKIGKIHFYAKPKTTPGWGPYYLVLEDSTKDLDINLQIHML